MADKGRVVSQLDTTSVREPMQEGRVELAHPSPDRLDVGTVVVVVAQDKVGRKLDVSCEVVQPVLEIACQPKVAAD
jgi:hypothetical protein